MIYQKRETLADLRLNLQNIYNVVDQTDIVQIRIANEGFQYGKSEALKKYKTGRAAIYEEFSAKSIQDLINFEQKELFDNGWGIF